MDIPLPHTPYESSNNVNFALIVLSAIITAIVGSALVAMTHLAESARVAFASGAFDEAAAKYQRS